MNVHPPVIRSPDPRTKGEAEMQVRLAKPVNGRAMQVQGRLLQGSWLVLPT
jgi:hypothetical protein